MNCLLETREETQLLLDYCAHALAAERVGHVETHIESCPQCQEFIVSQRALSEALDLWQPPPVPEDFNRRVYQRLDADAARPAWWSAWVPNWVPSLVPSALLRPFHPVWLRRGLPVAAAACLLVTAGVLLERPVTRVNIPKDMAQVESVQPEQVEQALDTMDLLSEFSHHVRTDGQESKL
jgi:anti-sigma factor RsiW